MISYQQGNLLEADVEAVVNTVNTVGVMGKGIALMFKERYPEIFKTYAAACKSGGVRTGRMLVTPTNELSGPQWVIHFPTKEHWRRPSQMEWIERGLVDLARVIHEKEIRSVALPPLGCGNGGLEWSEVRQRIESVLGPLEGVGIFAFEPTPKYQIVAKSKSVPSLPLETTSPNEQVTRNASPTAS